MRTIQFTICLLLACLMPRFCQAELAGPYTPDANTLFLFHFDEAAGGTVAANAGTKGGSAYSVDCNPASTTPPTVTTMLGAPGYVNGLINFGTCMTNPAGDTLFGYDFNNSGAYQGDLNNSNPSADRLAMTNLNIGNGGQTPFTLEALIRPDDIASGTPQEIITTDSSQASSSNRGFQFRLVSGTLNFQFVGGSAPRAVAAAIPTSLSDPNAFVAGNWYHVAAVYDGANITLYWTKLDPASGAADQIGSGAMGLGTVEGAKQGPLTIGNDCRGVASETFKGCIDEVRISSVARAANQMQFFSPAVTITLNPVSQNVDYNQPVTFSVGASSLTPLNAGTLVVTQPTLVNTTTVTVTNGALLSLDFAGAETNQVAGLVLDGVNQTAGLYNAGNSSPYLAGAGNLLVTSPVATNPTNISYAVSGNTLTLTWPGSHLGWYAQSNSVSLANTNFWFDIPGSQLVTNMVISISPAQTNVFYRLRNP